jgi:hypothetical protein
MTPTQTRNPVGRPGPPRPRGGTATPARPRTPARAPTPARPRTPARTAAPPRRRLEPRGYFRLTSRGAIVALFVLCFLSLLGAAWTGWGMLAYAAFVCGCGVVTYYTKFAGLHTLVVCPPLIFLAGCVCAEAVTSSGMFGLAEGVLVTLGTSAPWLFTGTALTIVIALGRGFRPAIPLLSRRAR